MILKLILLIAVIVVMFTVTLLGSFYGFQTFYDLRSQTIEFTADSICDEMYNILSKNNVSYDQMTNAIGDEQRWNALNFDPQEEHIIQQCLQEELPVLSSYPIVKKIGFLNGVNDHHAKGTAKIMVLEQTQYLRLEKFEISYTPKIDSNFKIPELHVYLVNGYPSFSDYIDLGKLNTNLGGKNYQLPINYTSDYDTIVIYDVIHKEEFAIIKMDNLFFIKDSIYNAFDQLKNIDSPTKIESRIIYERHGFFDGVNNYQAKGSAYAFYEEDKGVLEIEDFEISDGRAPELYLATNSDINKNGYWTFGPSGYMYIPNGSTNEIFRYDPASKKFVDSFVTAGSGGLNGPKDLMFSSDDKYLFVTSFFSNEVLRYDGTTGKFVDSFVTAGSGGLNGPKDLMFSSDDKYLFVTSFFSNEVLRYDGTTGKFVDSFVTAGSGGLNLLTGFVFGPDGNLYVTSGNTDEVLRYDGTTGKFVDSFVTAGSGGLNGPKDLMFSSDDKYLFVTSFFSNEVLRYDGTTGKFVDSFVSRQNGSILEPQHSLFGPDGNLYVTSGNTEVLRYDGTTGKFVDSFVTAGSGGLNGPKDLMFSSDDKYLFVTSFFSNEVLRYDGTTGKFVDSFVTAGSGGLNGPKDLMFSSDDKYLFVTSFFSNEVLRYDGTTGKFVDSFDPQNTAGLSSPTGIILGPDLDVYVVSSRSDQILRYSQSGEFKDVLISDPQLFSPTDILIDDKFIYVASLTNEVLRYDGTTGKFVDSFVTDSGDGVDLPTGLTFSPDGDLYVVSSDSNEIFRYDVTFEQKFNYDQFVSDKSHKLNQPTHIEIKNNQICVSSFNDVINCYDENTGSYVENHVLLFLNSLAFTDNSIIGPDGGFYVTNRLANEITKLDGTDPEFVLSPGTTFINTPSYITFKNDIMYVSSDDKILKFNGLTGEFQDVFVVKNDGSLRNPQGLVFTNDGLVVNSYNDRILKYDFEGKFIDEFIPSKDQKIIKPIGLAIDEDGALFSTQQGKILKFSAGPSPTLEKSFELEKIMSDILTAEENNGVHEIIPDPHGLVLDNNILYVSIFNKNLVLQHDLNTNVTSQLDFDVELNGPESLAIDTQNDILYISNSKNNNIVVYELSTQSSYLLAKNSGNGYLSLPRGLFFDNTHGFLYIANSDNNEILKFDPNTKSLTVFSKISGGSITPGGIAFDSTENFFIINENNNDIYRYDFADNKFLDVFVEFENAVFEYVGNGINDDDGYLNTKLTNIIFTHDDEFLFASDPVNDRIFVYNEFGSIHDVFTDSESLTYPTDVALTPDEKYLLVSNYGENTITRLSISDGFLDLTENIFVNPGSDGLMEITQIGFDPTNNLYVIGDTKTNILKYDYNGNFLGNFDLESVYLNKLSENLLKQYTLNDIDTNQFDILVVYDNFLEQSVAKIQLSDTLEFLSRINNLFYNLISVFNIIEEPQLKSKEIIKNTGFFIGNDIDAYGQVITKNVDGQLLIKIETFSIDYSKNDYVSIPNNFDFVGPQLTLCLEHNSQCVEPTNNELKINAGDNLYVLHNIDTSNLNDYRIVLHDKNDVLAYVPLKEYGVARVSLDSFVDWMQHYLPVFPFISLILIFPIAFDYIRSIFKLLFFPILWLSKKSKNQEWNTNSNKKVTILIPAHDEAYGIRESIESALATDYANKEIIVIDDGSKDDTYLIAYQFAKKGLIKLIHRDTASGSKATALNYGTNYATGDYMVCMDGDTKLDKNALKNSIPHFNDDGVVALSGNVEIVSGDDGVNNTVTNLQKYEYMVAIELGRRFTSFFGILLVISGAFGIFKKNLFTGVHTFDNDTLTEDFDLTLKFRKSKGVIRFVGNSIAYTYCPNTFSAWIKQRNRWAYGQFQTLLKNKNILTSKFSFRDKISFLDMFVLDILLALMFPVGLAVLGIIAVTLYFEDNLHVLVYPLFFTMLSFLMLEVVMFVYAVVHSHKDKSSSIKLVYLAPVMTFFYRPYLKMINLRGYIRAYFKRKSSW